MSKFRVAVIGTGMIANAAHLPAWKNLKDDVDVVAVADMYEDNAASTAKRYDVPKWYTDPQKMLDEVKPDVVSVCTPNCYHAEWSIAALKAGANVLCEKPVCTSKGDTKKMYATAEAAGKVLMVGQSGRFGASTLAAKEIADSGALGDVYYSETASMRRRGVPKWGMFHMKEHNAGGPLYDLGVHALDALLWILDNPKVTAASGAIYTKLANQDEGLKTSLADSGAPLGVFTPRPYDYHEFTVEDLGVGFLRLEDGSTISIKSSWAANVPQGFGGTIICGTKGGLQLHPLTYFANMGSYLVDTTPKVPTDPDISFYGHWKETAHFINVLRGEEELLVTKEQVLNVIGALDAIYKSAKLGKEVLVED